MKQANLDVLLCESLLEKHCVTRFYHITHVDNLCSILEHGLYCKDLVSVMGLHYVPISDPGIQEMRETRYVCQERSLSVLAFVPLFFHYRPPMLLRIKFDDKLPDQRDVAYLTIDPQAICDRVSEPNSCYFADGNVAARKTRLYSSPEHLDALNWSVIQKDHWDNDEESRVKGAEVLVRGKVWVSDLREIAVIDDTARAKVLGLIKAALRDSPIEIIACPSWYF